MGSAGSVAGLHRVRVADMRVGLQDRHRLSGLPLGELSAGKSYSLAGCAAVQDPYPRDSRRVRRVSGILEVRRVAGVRG